MNNLYIYSSKYEKANEHGEKIHCSVTVIFCERETITEIETQSSIKQFYQENYQTDEIFVICGLYNETIVNDLFINKQLETFKDIPKLERDYLKENLHLFVFDKAGKLICKNRRTTINEATLSVILNIGLANIFVKRGGLIEAKGDAHHFVFPSGKHCNKFLRTGNILLHSSEIYFIAFNILKHFDEDEHRQIYCDTSSINTLAFALLELKRRLIGDTFKLIPVESFSSYEGLFSNTIKYFGKSLILVSSSTSANIIGRITKHDGQVDKKNIIILYFLGGHKDYSENKSNIICNVTKSVTTPNGIDYYDTYTEKDCIYCKKGSYSVEVKGDIFLLEKPKINRVTIKVTDAPKKLSSFICQFKSENKTQHNVLKVNYKESRAVNNKYEVYFDMHHVLTEIEKEGNERYKEYKEKLFDYINQYIPSNVKFLISLPDEGSEKLTDIIYNHIKHNYKESKLPEKIKFDNVSNSITNQEIDGAAVIVGSCISNGKNLLYLSRALRSFDKLKLIYFIGLVRTNNVEYFDFLKSNLKQGNYGSNTNSFIDVENFYCTKDSINTTWIRERDFINELLELIDDKELSIAEDFFKQRVALIDNSLSAAVKGLANDIFYPVTSHISQQLELRKNFAFYSFTQYVDIVSQSDVYFTISAILNSLRFTSDYRQCLKQSEYVRNIIDPGNFNRFNDGIIQASILRGAKTDELSYHIDDSLSADMKSILEKIIEHYDTAQGEALIEFLYAISIERLTLKKEHLVELTHKIDKIEGNELVKAFNIWIKENLIKKNPTLHERIVSLEKENEELKEALRVKLEREKISE